MHACMHARIHTYINTYIHIIYIYIDAQTYNHSLNVELLASGCLREQCEPEPHTPQTEPWTLTMISDP